MRIGPYTHEEFMEVARGFHGYPAPGLIIGGYMVELARSHMPGGVLFDAVSETTWCLPDAIQLLTPCTIGNGWMRILDLGLYAMSLYDKRDGRGVRVWLDVDKLDAWPAIRAWFLKTTPKREQDTDQLQEEIYEAGISLLSARPVTVKPGFLGRREKGGIARCALCGEPHPSVFGSVCRSCQGESPYVSEPDSVSAGPALRSIPVAEAVGRAALHDMTRIEPGVSKGPAVTAGQIISGGDLCRLQLMGRNSLYVEGGQEISDDWVHENAVAEAFGDLMPGDGVMREERISEGKISFVAGRRGLLWVDVPRLEAFNRVPRVICVTRHVGSVVEEGDRLASTRAIPLYLSRPDFLRARNVLERGPLFSVLPLRRSRIGVLITGTEVFQGLIEDRFEPVVVRKVRALGCEVVALSRVPDDAALIRRGVEDLAAAGAEVIVTTAGLSVDPDDVTRKGLLDAGLTDMLYGVPILPGAMSLTGTIPGGTGGGSDVRVLGVPACALYHNTTAFDVLLPYVLADAPLTRGFLAAMGHGGLCLECRTCTYPRCAFAR